MTGSYRDVMRLRTGRHLGTSGMAPQVQSPRDGGGFAKRRSWTEPCEKAALQDASGLAAQLR